MRQIDVGLRGLHMVCIHEVVPEKVYLGDESRWQILRGSRGLECGGIRDGQSGIPGRSRGERTANEELLNV